MTSDRTQLAPTRFYGFARTRTAAENFAALKTLTADSSPASSPVADNPVIDVPPPTPIPEAEQPPTDSRRTELDLETRQGTASAVPTSEKTSGVSTPEADETVARNAHNSASHRRSRKNSCSNRKASRSRRPKPTPVREPEKRLSRLELHRAHCGICGSELQQEIDERFVNWDCVSQIVADYTIDRSSLYRHAHATGLMARRDRNIRRALCHLIQYAGQVDVTADSVVRAVKTFAHINARGEWVNPPTHVVFTAAAPRAPKPPRACAETSGTPSHLISSANP